MTTKSHYYLGKCLIARYFYNWTPLERRAFLFGCIEPDINLVTYLNGITYTQTIKGHNYPNMLPQLRSLSKKLLASETIGPLFCYRLGKLIHYLTDAFTFPHNTAFTGTMRDHVQYEEELEKMFLPKLHELHSQSIPWRGISLYKDIVTCHKYYIHAIRGYETDSLFTLVFIPKFAVGICNCVSKEYVPNFREARHDNFVIDNVTRITILLDKVLP